MGCVDCSVTVKEVYTKQLGFYMRKQCNMRWLFCSLTAWHGVVWSTAVSCVVE